MKRPTLVFISQPMKGLSREGIEFERKLILDDAPNLLGVEAVEEIPSLLTETTVRQMKPLYCLGMTIQLLAAADYAIFAPGWEEARGCRIEHECAVQYGIPVVDLSDGQIEGTLQ